ncbi:hypothetical protein L5G28_08535 [Gordonia sp. HY285]|uniref:relaxase/mobilization nuclease domain-containing protein n=1 Tax=Gordonia liuliyuniae TaxID=2911517 RepID=UPI001F3D985C|nr:hypothetical protein [Gordonia liuliyuniae]MCF8610204.1 hypothetical protein [Gordonia liuliyuniae]
MTTLSGSSLPFVKGFDDYISSAAAHDQDRPGGPSARVEWMSTLGDCRPETFVGDMLRTRLAYGKGDLEIDAYSYVLSHSHEELDPGDDELGAVAHRLAREWAREAWPGRQIKIVTQRDNGRWEGQGDDQKWVAGHWHSHIVVANVAEQEVSLRWQNADSDELVKSYPAGRAIDGDLKNIFRLRHVTDAVVLREWKYDNAAFVETCRKFADGSASKQDLAQRAERGHSTYDQVRLKLRTAAAQSVSWEDYVARCQAAAVDVRVRGKAGVSYSWIGDDGLERKARSRGKAGIGPEFTRSKVAERCAENAATLARGETLEVSEQALVMPTSTLMPDRPRPVYLTADGRPPWEQDEAAYVEYVRHTGGTYEGWAAQAVVAREPLKGVTLTRDGDAVTATVDTGSGPLVVDVNAELSARAADAQRAHAVQQKHAQLLLDQRELLDRREASIKSDRGALEAEKQAFEPTKAKEIEQARAEGIRRGYAETEDARNAAAVERDRAREKGYTEGIRKAKADLAEREAKVAADLAKADAAWAEVNAFDQEAAKAGMNRWIVQALREDTTTFAHEGKGNALDHYVALGQKEIHRQKGMGRKVDIKETEGQRRAKVDAAVRGALGQNRQASKQAGRQQDSDYGYGIG